MNEQEVFSAALEKSPEDRAAFLDEVCADDPQLRLQVQDLLQLHGRADGRFERPAAEIVATALGATTEKPGDTIGPFKLLENVGEGGMGAVYVAEQTEPVHRKVALKVIKPGMDSAQVVARFEAERQALAMMNHPNIAKVLDAGATESGRPYFVMELVKGVPATDYCDQHKLDIRQRLELFITICQAVHHAHQKGVIHRDIKPSNVLVELHDVRSVPKVIDFGVAKATNQRLTERTLHTGLTQMIGTPIYMSPEQAQLSGLDVDTRSDIYSLGVLLYELLTGTTPFESETLREAGFDEMRRMIREEEPPRPSDRVTTLAAEALSTISNRRQSDPYRLKRRLAGELDWIVMKALEKDRARRYESASSFASDVKRFLDDEPVLACPPSPGYKLRKFARRNKAAFTTVILVALTLLLGIAGTSWQAIVASQSRNEANEQRDHAQQQQQAAEENFQRAREAVDKYLTTVSEDQLLDEPGLQPLRRDLLELALTYYQQFAAERNDDAELSSDFAAAHFRVGEIRASLGESEEALKSHQMALEIREALVKSDSENADIRNDLVESYMAVSRFQSKWADAVSQLERAIAIAKPLGNPEHRATLGRVHAALGGTAIRRFDNKGGGENMQAAFEALTNAKNIFEELKKEHPKAYQPDDLSGVYSDFGIWHKRMGNQADARSYFERALKISRELADGHPDNIEYQKSLAGCYWDNGDHEKSLDCYRKLARANPSVVSFWQKLAFLNTTWGGIQNESGKLDESIATLEYSLEIYQRLARDYPQNETFLGGLGGCYKRLADALQAAGKTDQAAAAYQKSIATLKELTYFKGMLFDAYLYLSGAQEQAGKLEQSIASQKEALMAGRQLQEQMPNQLHYRTALSANHRRLGELFRKVERFDEAFTAHHDAVANLEGEFVDGNTPDGTPQQVRRARRELELSRKQAFQAETERLIGLTENDRAERIDKFYSNAERNDTLFLMGRGIWHRSHGELDLALADFRRASEQEPSSDAKDHAILLLLEQNRFSEAVEELPKATDLDSTRLFLRYVAVVAFVRDTPRYREMCASLLERFASSDTLGDIELCCKLCSLLPNAVEPSKIPLAELGRGIAAGEAPAKHHHWYDIGLAMACYRAGDWEQSRTSIREAQSCEDYDSQPMARALALSVLAMTEHQFRHSDEAALALNEASELLEQQWPMVFRDDAPGSSWPAWPNWLIARTLHREAATLLGQ